jgi:TldD protein
MTNRRDFLKAAAAVTAAAGLGTRAQAGTLRPPPSSDTFIDDLALEGLNAAKAAGASYADTRIGRYRSQFVGTRERQVTGVSDSESYGVGVRGLVGGSGGFAAPSELTRA